MDFSIFLINQFSTGPFWSVFDFEFEFAEILVIENLLPAMNDAGSRRLQVSLVWGVVDVTGSHLRNFFSRKISASLIRRVANSTYEESSTPTPTLTLQRVTAGDLESQWTFKGLPTPLKRQFRKKTKPGMWCTFCTYILRSRRIYLDFKQRVI